MTTALWYEVVAQHAVIDHLERAALDPRHAYLFVGPAGCTKEAAARAFAALLIDPTGDPTGRDARLALGGEHPDVVEFRRTGASIDIDTARAIVTRASRAPSEGARKVLILHEFHLLAPAAAATLLKVVEEPPPSTVFVILADQTPPELTTIASRCVRIQFRTLTDDDVAAALVGWGVPLDRARVVAEASGGDVERARLLADDPALEARRRQFADVPRQLDGTGSVVMRLVDELMAAVEAAAAPLVARHGDEIAAVEARVSALGERGSGRKALEDRHKRELRRHRTDELRAGLAAMARTYRDMIVEHHETRRPDALIQAVERIHHTIRHLDRNVNETLALQALLYELPGL
jgi:DNA polymerase III subunit delta'